MPRDKPNNLSCSSDQIIWLVKRFQSQTPIWAASRAQRRRSSLSRRADSVEVRSCFCWNSSSFTSRGSLPSTTLSCCICAIRCRSLFRSRRLMTRVTNSGPTMGLLTKSSAPTVNTRLTMSASVWTVRKRMGNSLQRESLRTTWQSSIPLRWGISTSRISKSGETASRVSQNLRGSSSVVTFSPQGLSKVCNTARILGSSSTTNTFASAWSACSTWVTDSSTCAGGIGFGKKVCPPWRATCSRLVRSVCSVNMTTGTGGLRWFNSQSSLKLSSRLDDTLGSSSTRLGCSL